jgi:4-amino-4-deoxy-L-arabinose transferase-like glycosyltransferase
MTRRSFLAAVILILVVAAALRTLWLTSDPPNTRTNGVGVVWHDEGAWVHNARNEALWGVWRTDNWNPMFLTPVFTVLEYGAFRAFGVGTWQARVVPAVSGVLAVGFLIAGLTAMTNRRAAVLGGALLAVNYATVMWNRAALMESTMTSLIVISWACYALAARRPWLGFVAGCAAVLAFFTKASAAFFVGALVAEAIAAEAVRLWSAGTRAPRVSAAGWTVAGIVCASGVIAVTFVLPHWTEYRFYNWQMSVTRKPEYGLEALAMRASWLPLVHDFFSWMWPLFALACAAMVGTVLGGWSSRPAARLLTWWVLLGLVELIVHDSGNERRYVMLLPALIALSASVLATARPAIGGRVLPQARFLSAALVFGLGYLVAASGIRMLLLEDVRGGHLHLTVMLSLAVAAIASALVIAAWQRLKSWMISPFVPLTVSLGVAVVIAALDVGHFATWARARTQANYRASIAVGRLLPPGTSVQGKLANGLALENHIRPIFIGHEFGNYADRLQRDDVRYILTYVSPSVGFESQAGSGLIQELLDRYPLHRFVATFPVDETGGPDRAALIEKFPEP